MLLFYDIHIVISTFLVFFSMTGFFLVFIVCRVYSYIIYSVRARVFREGLLKHEINSSLVWSTLFSILTRILFSVLMFFVHSQLPRMRGHACSHARRHACTLVRRFAKFSKRHGVSHSNKSSFLALSSHLVHCQHAFARFTTVSSVTSVRLTPPREQSRLVRNKMFVRLSFDL